MTRWHDDAMPIDATPMVPKQYVEDQFEAWRVKILADVEITRLHLRSLDLDALDDRLRFIASDLREATLDL